MQEQLPRSKYLSSHACYIRAVIRSLNNVVRIM
jgi:hypothetical protein